MNKRDSVIIGKVISTHGIHGWLSILCFSHPPENLKNYNTFIFVDDLVSQIDITDIKVMPKKVIIKIKDYDNITSSQNILGKDILIDKSDMPMLVEGEYYWRELEGLEVMTSQEKFLGVVDFIFSNGANDVLAIKHNNKYIYIALIKDNITLVPNKKIIIKHATV